MLTPIKKLELCEKAILLKRDIETNYLGLCELLSVIKKENAFEGQYIDWLGFLDEMRIARSTADKMIQIWEVFVLKMGIKQSKIIEAGGWTNVATLLPVIKESDKTTTEDWLHKASILSRSDLAKEIKETQTGLPMKECEHINSYKISICRDCGLRHEIYEPDSN